MMCGGLIAAPALDVFPARDRARYARASRRSDPPGNGTHGAILRTALMLYVAAEAAIYVWAPLTWQVRRLVDRAGSLCRFGLLHPARVGRFLAYGCLAAFLEFGSARVQRSHGAAVLDCVAGGGTRPSLRCLQTGLFMSVLYPTIILLVSVL